MALTCQHMQGDCRLIREWPCTVGARLQSSMYKPCTTAQKGFEFLSMCPSDEPTLSYGPSSSRLKELIQWLRYTAGTRKAGPACPSSRHESAGQLLDINHLPQVHSTSGQRVHSCGFTGNIHILDVWQAAGAELVRRPRHKGLAGTQSFLFCGTICLDFHLAQPRPGALQSIGAELNCRAKAHGSWRSPPAIWNRALVNGYLVEKQGLAASVRLRTVPAAIAAAAACSTTGGAGNSLFCCSAWQGNLFQDVLADPSVAGTASSLVQSCCRRLAWELVMRCWVLWRKPYPILICH